MLKAGVTIACAAAMLTAVSVLVRLNDTHRTPSPLSGVEPFAERLAVTTGRAAGMLAGAIIAGVLTIGAGGRLMMRVLAASSSDRAQGRITDAEEIVGEVSVGGSLFLTLGLGLGMGVLGLALFVVLRRWLPDRSMMAGLIGVAIGAGVLVRPTGLLSSANDDFSLLTPVALAVAFALGMLALFGATFGVLVDHLAPRWPRPGLTVRGMFSVLPFALVVVVPPAFVAVLIGTLIGTVAVGLREASAGAPPDGRGSGQASARGRILVSTLGGAGVLSVAVAAGQVLAL